MRKRCLINSKTSPFPEAAYFHFGMEHDSTISGVSPLKAIVTLVRWPNLLIIVFIQVLTFLAFDLNTALGVHRNGLLFLSSMVLMTTSAAAAGYVINDLFDRVADQINGRNNVLNSEMLSTVIAWRCYYLLNGIGALSTCALMVWSIHYLWIFIGVTILLWAYSKYLKRLPLIGNLAVSCFCAGVIVIMWFPALALRLMPRDLWILALFALLTTLIREIVKDLEDAAGDRHVGDRTLALTLGIRKTKAILVFLILVCIVSLIFVDNHDVGYQAWMIVFRILTILLLVWALVHLTVKARDQTGFHTVSRLIKVVMLTGTLSIVL